MDPIVYLAKNNNAGALDMQKSPLKQLSTIEIGTRISSEIPFDRSSSDSVSTKMHTIHLCQQPVQLNDIKTLLSTAKEHSCN